MGGSTGKVVANMVVVVEMVMQTVEDKDRERVARKEGGKPLV